MRRLAYLLLIALAVTMTACATSVNDPNAPDGPNPPDPGGDRPTAAHVLTMSDDFDFTFMPGEDIADVEWDIEIDYDTTDFQAVFDYYDAALLSAGFTQTDIETEGDEIEADYSNAATGVDVEIEVSIDDGNTEVDMDIDDFTGPFPAGFSLTEFGGLDVPIYGGANVVDVEWDFNFDHPSTSVQDVFDYYDGQLQDLGWTQVEIDDGDDDEMEAEYEREGVRLELEVEDNSEVELEFNKLRFY